MTHLVIALEPKVSIDSMEWPRDLRILPEQKRYTFEKSIAVRNVITQDDVTVMSRPHNKCVCPLRRCYRL
jgi:hypothetical protein